MGITFGVPIAVIAPNSLGVAQSGQRACLGSRGSEVQILPSRPHKILWMVSLIGKTLLESCIFVL